MEWALLAIGWLCCGAFSAGAFHGHSEFEGESFDWRLGVIGFIAGPILAAWLAGAVLAMFFLTWEDRK